jgi:hypothetical protein
MNWHEQRLPELVRALAQQPGHEAVRTLFTELLHSAFAIPYPEIGHEVYLPDNSGRIDTLWGAVVIEFKRNLERERADVEARMPDYLAEAARRSGSARPATGLATDGASIIAFSMRSGGLREVARYTLDPTRPNDLLAWLEPMLSARPDLTPDPQIVAAAFGRLSLTFGEARQELEALWAELSDDPEVKLKRDLWDGLLQEAYGEKVGEDALFLQHTYLTIVVKSIAACVLDLPRDDPSGLLSGRALIQAGIQGAVEADFFDWPLRRPRGAILVRQIAEQAARFQLRSVQADVLKTLYESLVDPDDRHDLGEYYTPDWLAGRVTAAAIDAPLTQRVLDPACGSGTFLFHALRRLIAAGQDAGWSNQDILQACESNVRGLDVHPVAVTLARVTWLLALGPLIEDRPDRLTVPVFLGDAMQWNLRQYLGGADVVVNVPGEGPALHIPAGFAEDQAVFEQGLDTLKQGLDNDWSPATVRSALQRISGAAQTDAETLAETFAHLQELYRAGRNGIWIFVFRNLVRPVWLSRPEQRADVLIGNPPWIVYRHLSAAMKDRVREALTGYDLWVGGQLATQQDLCALFWARGADRYLAPRGKIAFVLPYAALSGLVYAGLRSGRMRDVRVRLTGAWSLESVSPIFGGKSGSGTTSTCVLFGRRQMAGPHPAEVDRWSGRLPRRDASEHEAADALEHHRVAWPRPRTLIAESVYRSRFRQGATVVPRRFFVADAEASGRLGSRRGAPFMRGRAGPLDKKPWTQVTPYAGPVEARFLRPLILGETLAPFCLLTPVTAVIPLRSATVLNASAAAEAGFRHLADWLRYAEARWAEFSNTQSDGSSRMTLVERIDHMRNLSVQATPAPIRVLYSKAGTRLSAATVTDAEAIIDHMAYWAPAHSRDEAGYLTAIINSEAVLDKIKDLQPRGEVGRRHFDNLVWTLPIPIFDPADSLHRALAAAATQAEQVAAAVTLPEEAHFTRKRRLIRDALTTDGIAQQIEDLVAALLPQ